MKNHSFKTRLKIYKKMLIFIREEQKSQWKYTKPLRTSFCKAIFYTYSRLSLLKELPELYKYKPSVGWPAEPAFWFDPNDFETRINILEKIINGMENSLKGKLLKLIKIIWKRSSSFFCSF